MLIMTRYRVHYLSREPICKRLEIFLGIMPSKASQTILSFPARFSGFSPSTHYVDSSDVE